MADKTANAVQMRATAWSYNNIKKKKDLYIGGAVGSIPYIYCYEKNVQKNMKKKKKMVDIREDRCYYLIAVAENDSKTKKKIKKVVDKHLKLW